MTTTAYETVLREARLLTPEEQRRLIHELTMPTEPVPTPRRSLRGALADLGPGPSAEEIDEARREVWANVPRDEV